MKMAILKLCLFNGKNVKLINFPSTNDCTAKTLFTAKAAENAKKN